jgi:hypothetical protein
VRYRFLPATAARARKHPFKRWYPEHGLSSYDYANTIERGTRSCCKSRVNDFLTGVQNVQIVQPLRSVQNV